MKIKEVYIENQYKTYPFCNGLMTKEEAKNLYIVLALTNGNWFVYYDKGDEPVHSLEYADAIAYRLRKWHKRDVVVMDLVEFDKFNDERPTYDYSSLKNCKMPIVELADLIFKKFKDEQFHRLFDLAINQKDEQFK